MIWTCLVHPNFLNLYRHGQTSTTLLNALSFLRHTLGRRLLTQLHTLSSPTEVISTWRDYTDSTSWRVSYRTCFLPTWKCCEDYVGPSRLFSMTDFRRSRANPSWSIPPRRTSWLSLLQRSSSCPSNRANREKRFVQGKFLWMTSSALSLFSSWSVSAWYGLENTHKVLVFPGVLDFTLVKSRSSRSFRY